MPKEILGARNKKYYSGKSFGKMTDFTIQSIDPVDTSSQDSLNSAKAEINSNTNIQTQTIAERTLDIQVDAAANTAAINANTSSEVATIKETPVGAFVTLTQGSSYGTVLSHTGEGSVQLLACQLGDTGVDFGIKLTIDGNVYAVQAGNGSFSGYLAPSNVLNSTDPYYFRGGGGAFAIDFILNIKYKTSLLIEAYSNSPTASQRYVNYLVTKNL